MHAAERMVKEHLVARGIKNPQVLDAFRRVPRELFVEERYRADAYGDHPLPIGSGQSISQPFIVAKMTELLDVSKEMRVLEIGTGSGYQTAILAELAGSVYTVERLGTLLDGAKIVLGRLEYKNIYFRLGDGTLGWPEFAPYDRIIITAAAPSVPEPLFEQLKEFGKMVIPVGERYHQTLIVIRKVGGKKSVTESDECIFVPLVGKYGYRE